jgi:hypothetical protein
MLDLLLNFNKLIPKVIRMIFRDDHAILNRSSVPEMSQNFSHFFHFLTVKRILLFLRNVFIKYTVP